MELSVFAAVMFAALLHASWNAVVKSGGDKFQSMVMITTGHALIGAIMIPFFPLPLPASWGWLFVTTIIHIFYNAMLVLAYQQGDLSRVFPISRGLAPLGVLVVSAFFLHEAMTPQEVIAILIISAGILMLAAGVFRNRENALLIPFSVLAACGTMGYTLPTAWARVPLALPQASLRETSILFAMLIGIFVLGEKPGLTKIISGLRIVSGLVLIRL